MKSGFLLQVDKDKGLFGDIQPNQSQAAAFFEHQNPWEAYSSKSTGFSFSVQDKFERRSKACETCHVSKNEEESKKNVVSGPLLPKTLSSPILTLTNWYSSVYKTIQITSESFTTWCDEDPHSPRYSSIFRCPKSGEIFLCGRYGDPKNYQIRTELSKTGMSVVEVIWYTKKKLAQHAVAARVLDCYYYRASKFDVKMSLNQCEEDPYPMGAMDHRGIPISAPEIRVVEIKMNVSDEEGEHFRAREEYRKGRMIEPEH